MTNTLFSSLSEEIRYYMRELLSDKQLHSTAEVKKYVKNASNNHTISDGSFSGSIRDLLAKDPHYTNPKRGYYQFSDTDPVLLLTVEKIIEDSKNEIETELKKIDGSKITEDMFPEIVKTQKIVSKLEEIMNDFI